MPSPAVLRSNTVVEPLEERRCGGCSTVAAGVEREIDPGEAARHLGREVTRLARREDLPVAVASYDTKSVAVPLSLDRKR